MTTCLTLLVTPLPATLTRGIFPGTEPVPVDPAMLDRALARTDSPPVWYAGDCTLPADRSGTVTHALNDRASGHWAGMRLADIPENALIHWTGKPDFAPPQGETLLTMGDRIRTWLKSTAVPEKKALLVLRPMAARMLILTALRGDWPLLQGLDVRPSTLCQLSAHLDRWRLTAMGLPV